MNSPHVPASAAPALLLSAEALHDLRTPLNQILGYSEMLTEQALEEGQSGYVPDLQKIQAAGLQLLALLNTGLPAPTATKIEADLSRDTVMTGIRNQEPQTGATQRADADSEVAQSLILVVDDSKTNRDMLARRIERQGYSVATAASGREALDAVRAQAFDLVLLDIMMPEMDGYAVLEQIKAEEGLRSIPIIMISALDEMDSVARCIEMGAEDYLPKPSNLILLKARIGACLEKKRARDREQFLVAQLQQSDRCLKDLEKRHSDLTSKLDDLLNSGNEAASAPAISR